MQESFGLYESFLYLWTMSNKHSTKGSDLAWDIFVGLRSNQFKDMTLEEIDDFRTEMASFLNLKKES
tara:strand:+ start:451 stop:651 length:201 start_codon:yes stop_codon:yes gene_type:complete